MNGYLLDTNICIYLFKGKFDIREKIRSAGFDCCYISEITLAELIYGAVCSQDESRHTKEIEDLLSVVTVLPIRPVFHQFSVEKKRLRLAGTPIENFDLLIGATALVHSLIMVTENEKHFRHIQNLQIENWAV